MTYIKKVISTIILISVSTLAASTERYKIEMLNTTSSQSHYNVKNILQDSFGLTWIVFNRGVGVFDGYKMKDFQLNEHNRYWQNDMLWDIKEDCRQNLWIASSEHLILYNRRDESLTKFPCNMSYDMPVNRKIVSIWREYIYVLSGKQIWRYTCDYDNNRLLKDNRFEIKMTTEANTLYIDSSGQLWIGRADGVYIITGSKELKKISPIHCMSITEHGGNIYFGGRVGVYSCSVSGTTPIFIAITDINIRKIFIDRGGVLWLATYRGVYFCDLAKGEKPILIPQTEHNNIYAITQDYSGTILVSIASKGIMMIKPIDNRFKIVRIGDKNGYNNGKVRSIFEDSSDNLWIGTQEDGARVVPKGADIEKICSSNQNYIELNSAYENTGYQFVEDTVTKSVYVGTGYPNWLLELSSYHNSVASIKKRVVPNINSAAVTLIKDEEFLWAGTFIKGLLRIAPNSDVTHINPGEFEAMPIYCIYADASADIWVASGRGLFLIPKDEKGRDNPSTIAINKLSGFPQELVTKEIVTIFQTKNGDVWLGSSGAGLFRIRRSEEESSWQFARYTKDDGLSSNYIMAMLEDERGNLWVSTNNGITRMDTRTNQCRYFYMSDNGEENQFGELSACRRSDGMMLFGGRNGISIFYPDSVMADSIAPKVQITLFSVYNKPVKVGQKLGGRVALKENLLLLPEIKLSHDQNSISFEFTSTHTAAPEKNRYRYILKNFDKEWSSCSAENRIASYTNLPAGRYTFIVKASNNNGLWSESPATIDIRIYAPFWARWYAYIIYLLVICMILYLFRRYIIKEQAHKTELLLARQEKEQIKQLSISKQQFFANVSHELRTPLTLILAPLDRLLKEESTTLDHDARRTLQLVDKSAKSLLRLNNMFLDLLRKEYDFKINMKIGNIELFIEDMCQRFREWATERNIELTASFELSNQHVWFDPGLLEQILLNIVSNAIKNTPAQGFISVSIKQTDTEYLLSVSDTGHGIAESIKPHIFARGILENHKSLNSDDVGAGIGLALTKNLVQSMGWRIDFESIEGHGTTFYVHIPIEQHINADECAPVEMPKSAAKPLSEVRQSEISLLVVEDHAEMCNFIADSFQQHYTVHKASDGEQALEILEQVPISIIISDIMMPHVNGLELCRLVKNNIEWSHIPVILLTAQSVDETQIDSYNVKADAYCQKPFEIDVLSAIVLSLLANRQALYDKFKGPIEVSPSQVTFNSPDAEFLARLISIVEHNISDSGFTVVQLADAVTMTQQRLNNKLSGLTNMKANAFIRNIRLKRAAQLLTKTTLNITETMYEVGFEDPKYFRNCFKDDFGMSPSEYQKSHTEEVQTE